MRRPGYREAIEWVALNDSPGDPDALDPVVASGLVSSTMIAHLFDVPADKVGRDIVRVREREQS